jgi:MSHA biogenesis protein MshI
MRQQINLYDPILRQPRPVFSAAASAQGLVLVFLGLLLFHAYAGWRVSSLAANVEELRGTRELAEKRYQALQARTPRKTPDPGMEGRIAGLTEELGRATKLADALGAGGFGNASGMSGYLVGLARQRIDGLWLTRIDIRAGGNAIDLAGRSGSAEQVPQYLQKLSGEQAFKGRTFGGLALRVEETGVSFRLGSSSLASESAGEP